MQVLQSPGWATTWVSSVATLGIAFLLLIFSEVIPKTFASRHSEWLAFRYLKPFALVEVLLLPVSVFLELIGRFIVKVSGGRVGGSEFG